MRGTRIQVLFNVTSPNAIPVQTTGLSKGKYRQIDAQDA